MEPHFQYSWQNILPFLKRAGRGIRWSIAIAFISAGGLANESQRSLAQEFELRLEHSMPAASIQQSEFFLPWARRIEAASNGRIRISVTPAMGLGGAPSELLGKAERGEVDIVWASAGWTPGRFPKLEVFELPWVISSRAAVTSLALQEYYETHARDELENVHMLAVWCHSGGVIMTKDRQIIAPSDLKGLRIRTPSTQISDMLSALGAEPKLVPAPMVVAELDQGHLDGALFPYEVIPTFRLKDRVHHISEFAGDRGLHTAVFILAMSRDAYMRLPPDLRRVIDDNSGMKLVAELGRLWDEFETTGRDAYQEGGGGITFIKGEYYETWLRQTQPSVEAWIRQQKERGADGEMLLKSAKELIAKYSTLWGPYRE
jgi:TRAP-type transport system periplasmic protein